MSDPPSPSPHEWAALPFSELLRSAQRGWQVREQAQAQQQAQVHDHSRPQEHSQFAWQSPEDQAQWQQTYPLRRRISIANGQINELNANTLDVDSLYASQPPPLPLSFPLSPNTFAFTSTPTPISNKIEPKPPPTPSHKAPSKAPHKATLSSTKATDPETKRKILLEKNRIAAVKSRRKKKLIEKNLNNNFNELLRQNKALEAKIKYYDKLINYLIKFLSNHKKENPNPNECNLDNQQVLDLLLEFNTIKASLDDNAISHLQR
ncbi:hypothetical protein TBLA_0E02470 [Henningerozyma blattae CBS 6284]|uniref:BZIP domain-containing protein n=1 Tax=Henningerozyma blattae (strain ATCC 34711 / CBS 6284 / DSM 70876 / NBRC 10599 / NRRL Y-10934 / UCD 77-7) TaxID=1071380 RepID=I2H4J9_HENB6|nr:hypothetical protein TBLA_0E02470 [Tetrapisispora blattae CBS 6284]CCH61301.1 hypothetical protein TBLA_0E02470 [Tetrapisispora blattae CBS 6284]